VCVGAEGGENITKRIVSNKERWGRKELVSFPFRLRMELPSSCHSESSIARALSAEAETGSVSRSVIPAQAGIQFLFLDSGSRPAALPGMTGCHERRIGVEDFVSEQEHRDEESLLLPSLTI